MASIAALNPKAEYAKSQNAFNINLSAAKGLYDVLKSNLGPKGTLKMLVSGAGDIKLTKDGNVCLQEMQIKHPTASLIARVATAQDDITGDGTTSIVLMIAELLKQADGLMYDGLYMQSLHPRIITEGMEIGKLRALELLDKLKIGGVFEVDKDGKETLSRTRLLAVAQTSVRTKLHAQLATQLSEHIVDAIMNVWVQGEELDIHRVEIMQMQHKRDMDSRLVKGLVLDHGGRHPDMPKRVENAHILTLNVSMEYEKTEINSGFFYKSAEERQRLVQAEREFIDERVRKVIALKRRLCEEAGDQKIGFVVINQKGIDPLSLDLLAKEGILALRRAKRRNMERLALACGGYAINCVDELTADCLGYAGLVYEYGLGDDKFTFVEECKHPQSVTLLVKGPNKHTLVQIKDTINDGLKAVKNAVEDRCVVPGGGAFELAAHLDLMRHSETVAGRVVYGVEAFARALLVIPRVLAQNSGFDVKDCEVRCLHELRKRTEPLSGENAVGIDLDSGEPMKPHEAGVYDNFCVKRQIVDSACVIATNLLLVDEMMRAGLESLKG